MDAGRDHAGGCSERTAGDGGRSRRTREQGGMTRAEYDAALAEVRNKLGSGYAIVPLYPDDHQICAALDHWDKAGRHQSYSDIYNVMVMDYVARKDAKP